MRNTRFSGISAMRSGRCDDALARNPGGCRTGRGRRLAALTFFIVAVSVLETGIDAADPQKLTMIEGITEYRLDNGLQVLLFPDPSKPTVTVNLTIFVGSRHEGYGEAGMAHLLEHMLFKGTPDHPNVPKVLQERGSRFNGTTWFDRTNYYETLPASDDNLEFAIRLEADRMMNSYVKGEDLASEMTVVRNEFERGENSPTNVLEERMMSAAFEWHNYGKSTIGNRADIERVPVERLRVFYRKHYQPDNALLVIAGKFPPDKALAYTQKYFGEIPRPKRRLDATYTEEPAQDGERFVTLRRVGDVSVAGVIYHVPSGAHPDYAVLDILESILTAAPAGRLYKALVETKKAGSVSGAAWAFHDPGVLRLMAEVSSGNEPRVVLDTMLDVVEGLAEEGVSAEEVERARQRLLKLVELAANNSTQSAIELSEWAAQGDWRLKFLYRDRVEKVTPEQVKQVAAKYLRRNNRTVGLFLPVKSPERVKIPATPNLAEMIGDYKGRKAVAVGEAFDVTPENIDARTQRFSLPNGMKVAFLEKKTRGEAIQVRLTIRYGNETNLKGLKSATEVLPQMMVRGTEDLSRQQLTDELDKNRIRLSASGSAGEATFGMQTKRANVSTAFELLRQVLREPTLLEQELDVLKQGQLTSLQQRLTDPQSLGFITLRRKFRPYPADDPRYEPTLKEQIERAKSLNHQTLKDVYSRFFGAAHADLAVVGDFDSSQMKGLIENTFKDWNASEDYAHIPQHGDFEIKGGLTEIMTPGKASALYVAGFVFPMKDDHPDYPALLLGNFILGVRGSVFASG